MNTTINETNFPKLSSLIKETLVVLDSDWPKIIGQGSNLNFSLFEHSTYEGFYYDVKDLTVLLEFGITGKYSGKFFLKFAYRDAIIISGTMLMEEEDEIQENINTFRLNDEYKDAFNEFANQTSVSFENVFKSQLLDEEELYVKFVKSHHLIIDQARIKGVLFPSKDDELFITSSQCSIWSFDKGEFSILFPLDLVESFFNETVKPSAVRSFAQILVVDNSLTAISFIKKCLRNTGYTAVVCEDSDTAIAKLRSERVDAVLMEVNFKTEYEDGLVLCHRIRRNMIIEAVPIIMCSTKPTKNLIMDAIKNGASDFLVKPFEKKHLISKLEKHIRRTKHH